MPKKLKVVVGMSGGVDSSVAAYLLQQQGHDVIGLFMRNWDSSLNKDIQGNPDIHSDVCEQERDYQDALAVCNHLGIPLHRVDFIEEYWRDVFQYFIAEYEKGRTPNPDILCNKYIKFEAFYHHAQTFNPDAIAMGHYARLSDSGPLKLLRGIDDNKDQTYFLSQLKLRQLEHVLFPVGGYSKAQIRKLAEQAQLPTALKKDSTGICFIGEREFNAFLTNYLPAQKGPIKTLDGDVLGEHTGLMHYTIGQRKGLGIGGHKTYGVEPWFVLGKDLKTQTLWVGQGYHHKDLYGTHAFASDINIIRSDDSFIGRRVSAKFRHRQKDVTVTVSGDEKQVKITFEEPVRAVTPGQAVVFYDGEICLGGAFIDQVYQEDRRLPV